MDPVQLITLAIGLFMLDSSGALLTPAAQIRSQTAAQSMRTICDTGTGPDCNSNGVPDACDIAAGTSQDCDGGGIPDECELGAPRLVAKLIASNAASVDYFGGAIALDGDTALVGATGADGGYHNSGSAYVFKRIDGAWQEVAMLTVPDVSSNAEYGGIVALDGDVAVVSAPIRDGSSSPGAVYVFQATDGNWELAAQLDGDAGAGRSGFGHSISVSDGTVMVGNPYDGDLGNYGGAVYVFRETDGGWNRVAKLTATDTEAGDSFGGSVAVQHDTVVIGALGDDDAGNDAGAVYVFSAVNGDWFQVAKLNRADVIDILGSRCYGFGDSVALDGDTILVGSIMCFSEGGAYLYRHIGGRWQQICKLSSPAPEDYGFGGGVSLGGGTAVVRSGATRYVYRETAGTWRLTSRLNPPAGGIGDGFVVHGDTALIGASDRNQVPPWSGAVYVFDLSGPVNDCNFNGIPDGCDIGAGTSYDCDADGLPDECVQPVGIADCNRDGIADACDLTAGTSLDCNGNGVPDECDVEFTTETAKIRADMPLTSDYLGSSVALTGETLIAGAAGRDGAVNGRGAALVFRNLGTPAAPDWVEAATLTAHDGASGDWFGYSVAASGVTTIIGTYRAEAAYVFREVAGNWVEIAKLALADGAAEDHFGRVVDISGDTAIVGAEGRDATSLGTGAAYLYRETAGVWQLLATLHPQDGLSYGHGFGAAVAIDGDTAVVGAPYDDNGGSASGSAFVFREIGGTWQQVAKLHTFSEVPGLFFGSRVDVSGQTLVAAEYYSSGFNLPKAYVFREFNGAWHPDWIVDDFVGGWVDYRNIAVDNGTLAAGVYRFDRYRVAVYRSLGDSWLHVADLAQSDPEPYRRFGNQLAVYGTQVAASSQTDSDGILDSGSVYYFDLSRAITDCNGDATPDSCELVAQASFDCNTNGVLDECDLAFGAGADCNGDGLLDECLPAGDANGDGTVDLTDVAVLVDCQEGPAVALPTDCCLSDLDGDGDSDLADFAAFQNLLGEQP